MGYRLPLDSQPWVGKGDYPWIHPIDQSAPQPPLPLYATIRQQFQIPGAVATDALKATAAAAATAAINALEGTAPALKQQDVHRLIVIRPRA